jgi:adenylyltransferase/sulfurtransferase
MDSRDQERFSRQIRFSELGPAGQELILRARVTIVGCGALGSFQAGALARAGLRRLRLVDRDYVELSNLQRQWLFEEADADQALPKAVAAARKLRAIDAASEVEPFVTDLTSANAEELLGGSDLLLDGTDNFETRYLINDFSVSRSIPWIYGAAVGSYGLVMPVLPGDSACLRCVYPDPPEGLQPTCETAGVLGPITSLVASLQVAEALKILAGQPERVSRRISTIDVWSGVMRQIDQPERRSDCPCCGRREFTFLDGSRRVPISLCGRNAVQIHERSRPIDLEALGRQLAPLGEVRANEFALRFFLPPYEMTVFPDGRAIIKGTQDVGLARGLYAKYVGS